MKIDSLNQQAANAKRLVDQGNADKENDEQRLKDAHIRAEDAMRQSKENAARINSLPSEIIQTKQIEDVKERTARQTDLMNSQTGVGEVTQTGPHLLNFGQLAEATGKSHAQTLAILNKVIEGHLSYGQAVEQMQWQLIQINSALAQHAQQLSNMRNNF